MRKRTKTIMLALTTLLVLAGCGQKGPLYLPEEPEQTEPEAQAQVERLPSHISV
ncbi:LPS translocon maturation chaperone LptM [Aliidiomarina indica]|uniref:LPS translocon maturation chaperone LptM n=1 Tax=Aliidiomarina indica TaxID=2749147 RepID=UPI00188F3018|nr:lipoprotein [Aliidiomarina indica]